MRILVLAQVASSMALLAISSPLGACDALESGRLDNLEFRFDADDRLIPASFGTPLATGLKIDVLAFEAGSSGKAPVTVSLAHSRNQGVARVPEYAGNRVTLSGRAPGSAEIEITAAAGNDYFDVTVADIAKLTLSYPGVLLLPESPPVRVVQGGVARFGVDLKDDQGRGLIGYGAFPVTITPATAGAARASTDVAHLSVEFAELGAVTLSPLGADDLEVTVVPATDVASVTIEIIETTTAVGGTALAVVRGATTDGDIVVGLSELATVTSETPQVCTVKEAPKLGDAVFTVTAAAAGECQLTATFEALTATDSTTITPRDETTQ